jgi:hypothetical protein
MSLVFQQFLLWFETKGKTKNKKQKNQKWLQIPAKVVSFSSFYLILKKKRLMPIILATWEAEIGRI